MQLAFLFPVLPDPSASSTAIKSCFTMSPSPKSEAKPNGPTLNCSQILSPRARKRRVDENWGVSSSHLLVPINRNERFLLLWHVTILPYHPPDPSRDYTHFLFFCWPTLGVFLGRNQLVKFGEEREGGRKGRSAARFSKLFVIAVRPSARFLNWKENIIHCGPALPSGGERAVQGAWEKALGSLAWLAALMMPLACRLHDMQACKAGWARSSFLHIHRHEQSGEYNLHLWRWIVFHMYSGDYRCS